VVVQTVTEQRISDAIEALGTTRAAEAIDITAKTGNLITAIRFAEGALVARGAVLVEMDSAQVRADLAAAEAALAESRSQYKRSRELYATKVLSTAQLEQIEATLKANEARVAAANARLADTILRAPFAGRTGLRRVSVGSFVAPGTVITTLDDTSTLKLDFTLPEALLASWCALPAWRGRGVISAARWKASTRAWMPPRVPSRCARACPMGTAPSSRACSSPSTLSGRPCLPLCCPRRPWCPNKAACSCSWWLTARRKSAR
jgi:biotin carboxyl carrier protein